MQELQNDLEARLSAAPFFPRSIGSTDATGQERHPHEIFVTPPPPLAPTGRCGRLGPPGTALPGSPAIATIWTRIVICLDKGCWALRSDEHSAPTCHGPSLSAEGVLGCPHKLPSPIRPLKVMLSASRLQRAVAGRLGLQTLAARWKTTTGIVGLPVDEEARPHLEEHYELVLDTIKVIPETAVYRQTVEKTVQKRLAALRTDASDEELEQQFGRQLEEEIRVMQGELRLIPKMAGEYGTRSGHVCWLAEGEGRAEWPHPSGLLGPQG